MFQRIQKVIMAVAVLGAIAVGSAVIANAASNRGATGQSGTSGTQGAQTRTPPQRQDETPLTGDTADKVRQAALDKVPGATVLRVETDAEGSPYEAHLRKSDGTLVTVKVDKAFSATAVEDFRVGPRGGHGGRHHGGPGRGETPLTGDTADKVRQAALDKVPGATVLRVETDAEGSPYEAHVRKSNGTEVVVKVNKDFNATDVQVLGPPGQIR